MSMSRQNVNRLLKRIVREEIVKIQIIDYMAENIEIERRLEETYRLKDAVVISDLEDNSLIKSLGQAGADYINGLLSTYKVFGIGWGRTLKSLAENIKERHKGVSVVQLAGDIVLTGTDDQAGISANRSDELIILLSQRLGAMPYFLHVPVLVENSDTKKAMMEEYFVKNSFEMIERCEFAVHSIAGVGENITPFKESYLNMEDFNELIRKGAVGNINFRYYDINGKPVHTPIEDRLMVPTIEQLKKIPLTIGIGGGKEKEKAVLGALRGKLVDVLITNIETANFLLENR